MSPTSSKQEATGSDLSQSQQELMSAKGQQENRELTNKTRQRHLMADIQLDKFNNDVVTIIKDMHQNASNFVNRHKKFKDQEKSQHLGGHKMNATYQALNEARAKEMKKFQEKVDNTDKQLSQLKLEMERMQQELEEAAVDLL